MTLGCPRFRRQLRTLGVCFNHRSSNFDGRAMMIKGGLGEKAFRNGSLILLNGQVLPTRTREKEVG